MTNSGVQVAKVARAKLVEPFYDAFHDSGCRVERFEDYQNRYNIDFLVTRVQGVHAAVNLGIHITAQTENYEQQAIFLEAAKRGVVSKSAYIEVCSSCLDAGVIPISITACLAFVFDRRYQHTKTIGLRVFEDSTFHFFDLEENVRRLRKGQHDDAHQERLRLNGEIIAYFCDKGFGFIEEKQNEKYFFHIANVSDESLRMSLPSYTQGETIPVSFLYGGSEGKKYPKAVEVTLAEGGEMDDMEDMDDYGGLDDY